MNSGDSLGRLEKENSIIEDLRSKLREAEETLDAIRNGEVDAVLVKNAGTSKIFTLVNADRPYRFLIEQMKEGALTLSKDGVILYGNRRLGEILGTPLENAVASNIKRYLSIDDTRRFETLLSGKVNGATRAEFIIMQPQGVSLPVVISVTDIVSGDGSERLIGGVITDLTDQREMEARLSQAQKMEAIGQLTGGLAHDFNNLLQAVCGNLDMIKTFPGNVDSVKKWAVNGLKAAARGTKLTAQLLAFSRSQTIDVQPVDVAELITGMADLLLRTLSPEIEIEYVLEKSAISVMADKTQLELALLNLAINAQDSMPNGGRLGIRTRLIDVDVDPELPAGRYVEFRVSDTGCGMSDIVRSRAFDPFFTTKKMGEGTGLGLAQVYGITRQAGGTARIESSVGSGTVVTLLLRQTSLSENFLNEVEESLVDVAKVSAKILLVDDDDDTRHVLTECLVLLGYDVAATCDGFTALEMMAAGAPDLLLTDYAMPKINGAELVKRARAQGFNMPVIFVSGYANTKALDDAIGFKATVLVKPCSLHELAKAIETELSSGLRKRG